MLQEEQSRAAEDTADTGGGKGPVERSAMALAEQPSARKWVSVLRALLAGSLNRFEATRPPVKDWCLPSTISELEKRGLRIDRRDETVPGAFGPVRCCRYWIADESRERASGLIGQGTAS